MFGRKEFVVFLNSRSGMFDERREMSTTTLGRHVSLLTSGTLIPCKHIFVSFSVKQKLLPVHKALLEQEFGLMV